MKFIIREMLPCEYPVLKDFLYEAIYQKKDAAPLPAEMIEDPALQLYITEFGQREDDHCLCAVVENTLIGAVWTRIIPGYGHIDAATPELAISLYKEYRGYGIGTALLKRMLLLLREKGTAKVSLAVQKENPALSIYQKTGFRIRRETEDEYIMEARLNAHP